MNQNINDNIKEYPLNIAQLNSTHEKVMNCKVVKPPYEVDSFYKDRFFLDKRDGFIENITVPGITFTDRKTIEGNNFYLGNNGSNAYIYNNVGTQVAGPFAIATDSPLEMFIARGAGGNQLGSGTLTLAGVDVAAPTTELALYGNGYVKLDVGAAYNIGDYIVFKTGVLAGTANEIRYVVGNEIYILGTNVFGTLPSSGDTFSIMEKESEVLLVGGTSGLYIAMPNGTGAMLSLQNFTNSVTDIEQFNGNFFIISGNSVFYTRSTFDDNTSIYPTDFFKIRKGQKLISLGKMLLLLGEENKVITSITDTTGVVGYVASGLQYYAKLYSKYSYVVFDSVFYILQDDNRLIQVDVVGISNTQYQVVGKDVALGVKGMFNTLIGDIRVNRYKKHLNFMEYNGSITTNYQYNLEYQHWIIQQYEIPVKLLLDEGLYEGGVANIGGTQDLLTDYEQEVNIALGEDMFNINYINKIRTIFGTNGVDKIDLVMDSQHEIDDAKNGPMIHKTSVKINNMMFDTTLNSPPILDDLVGYENVIPYEGNIASIEVPVTRSGRYNRFKYHGINRFIFGDTFMFYGKHKATINNINM